MGERKKRREGGRGGDNQGEKRSERDMEGRKEHENKYHSSPTNFITACHRYHNTHTHSHTHAHMPSFIPRCCAKQYMTTLVSQCHRATAGLVQLAASRLCSVPAPSGLHAEIIVNTHTHTHTRTPMFVRTFSDIMQSSTLHLKPKPDVLTLKQHLEEGWRASNSLTLQRQPFS